MLIGKICKINILQIDHNYIIHLLTQHLAVVLTRPKLFKTWFCSRQMLAFFLLKTIKIHLKALIFHAVSLSAALANVMGWLKLKWIVDGKKVGRSHGHHSVATTPLQSVLRSSTSFTRSNSDSAPPQLRFRFRVQLQRSAGNRMNRKCAKLTDNGKWRWQLAQPSVALNGATRGISLHSGSWPKVSSQDPEWRLCGRINSRITLNVMVMFTCGEIMRKWPLKFSPSSRN